MSSLSAVPEDVAVASIDEELSPEDVIGRYKAMRNDIKKLTTKVDELEAEFNEHQLVISAISSMELGRKAFRLVGGVLIQQTVGEVLPAVTSHQAMVINPPFFAPSLQHTNNYSHRIRTTIRLTASCVMLMLLWGI
jgi:prefoldin subunit 2